MEMKQIIEDVYQEAINCEYPETPKRTEAIKNLLPYLEGENIWDFCPQEKELIKLDERVKPLIPTVDMHEYLDKLQPLEADMIVVRHVLEHSIMPYVLLKLLKKHSKKLLIVIPENNKSMIDYLNHYSVMDDNQFNNLCNKAGLKAEKILEQTFQSNGNKESVFKVTRND